MNSLNEKGVFMEIHNFKAGDVKYSNKKTKLKSTFSNIFSF